MHNVLIISYIAFSIGNLFILPESTVVSAFFIGSRNFLHSLATIGVKG